MTVRITKRVESGVCILQVDGWLRSDDVNLLYGEYGDLDRPVALELSQLQSADATGIAALLELSSQGTELRGVSSYVKLLLSRSDMTSDLLKDSL
jgi:ABC-type transporter Mla MlaB component